MKSNITAIFALFFFLVASTASATFMNQSTKTLKTIPSDMLCAKEEKKIKAEEEPEPECD